MKKKRLLINVRLKPEEKIKYETLSNNIKETMNLFDNDFNLIQSCITGVNTTANGDKLYASGSKYLFNFAESKGWSTDLDLSIDYYKRLDEVYNPIKLYERLEVFNKSIRERLQLINFAEEKQECVGMILDKIQNSQFIVFNSSLSLADKIAIDYNKRNSPNEEQLIVSFHSKTPTVITDDGRKFGQTKLKKYIIKELNEGGYKGISVGLHFNTDLIIPNIKIGIITGLDKYKQVQPSDKITYSALNENDLFCTMLYIVCVDTIEKEGLKKYGLYNNLPELDFDRFKERYIDFETL